MIYISKRNTIVPTGIVIHHTAVSMTPDGRAVDMSVLASDHRRKGYRAYYWGKVYYVGYHYVIFPDGSVKQGRPETSIGAHAVGHNSDLGICLVGNFSSVSNPHGERGLTEPTEAQLRSLDELSRTLLERYRLPLESVRRHRDVNPDTECPGDRFLFEGFRSQLEARRH